MGMGRRRRDRADLPERLYHRHGAYYFVDRDGRWHWLARDRAIALRKHAELTLAPRAGNLAGLLDRYLREIAPTKAPRTLANNLREAEPLRRVFGLMEPDEVTPQDLYAYLDRRPRVAGNRELSLLASVFQCAIRWGLAADNPCRLVDRNPEPPRRRHVELAEYAAVHAIAAPVIQCAMAIARHTGLRLGDILRLNEREHLRDDGIHVETRKTGRRMHYEYSPELRAAVDRARTLRAPLRSIWLIATTNGQAYSVSGFETLWQRTMLRAMDQGLLAERFRFNDLRAMAAGLHDAPSELLGHDDPATTNRIYRRAPRRVKPAR